MARCEIRFIPDEVLLAINEMAREENKSRDQFLREQLTAIVDGRDMEEEVKAIQADLFSKLLPTLERNNEVLERLLSRF